MVPSTTWTMPVKFKKTHQWQDIPHCSSVFAEKKVTLFQHCFCEFSMLGRIHKVSIVGEKCCNHGNGSPSEPTMPSIDILFGLVRGKIVSIWWNPYHKTYNMVNRATSSDRVLDLPSIDRVPYLLQNCIEFIGWDGPRVVISTSKVHKCWDEELSPDIVGCGARREVILDILLVDPTTWMVRPGGAAWCTLGLLGWWCIQLGVFFVSYGIMMHWPTQMYVWCRTVWRLALSLCWVCHFLPFFPLFSLAPAFLVSNGILRGGGITHSPSLESLTTSVMSYPKRWAWEIL